MIGIVLNGVGVFYMFFAMCYAIADIYDRGSYDECSVIFTISYLISLINMVVGTYLKSISAIVCALAWIVICIITSSAECEKIKSHIVIAVPLAVLQIFMFGNIL